VRSPYTDCISVHRCAMCVQVGRTRCPSLQRMDGLLLSHALERGHTPDVLPQRAPEGSAARVDRGHIHAEPSTSDVIAGIEPATVGAAAVPRTEEERPATHHPARVAVWTEDPQRPAGSYLEKCRRSLDSLATWAMLSVVGVKASRLCQAQGVNQGGESALRFRLSHASDPASALRLWLVPRDNTAWHLARARKWE